MRTIEVREEEHYQKWHNAMNLWLKRKDAHVMKLAKSYFAKIKNELLKKALRQTGMFTHLNNSEKMLLSRSTEYTGYSLDEDFPVFDKFLSVEDLKPFFELHSDLVTLDKFIKDAENKAKVPKFLTMDEPKWLKVKKATEELEAQKDMLQQISNFQNKKIGKSKFGGLKF